MFERFSTMDDWEKITFKVAVYMFLFEVRPLESYLTAYLTGPNGNVSLFEVANWMESVRSYSALTSTVIMLAISEHLYKPVIVAFTFCSFVAYLLMTGSPGLTQLRVSVAGIGATSNAYVLVFSYLFAQIDDKKRYQQATSIVSVSLQLGIFVGCVLSQTVVGTSGGIYTALPYINAFAMFMAVICVCLFPPVRRRRSFLTVNVLNENTGLLGNNANDSTESDRKNMINKSTNDKNAVEITSNELLSAFKTLYFDPVILKRSFWYIIRMAAHSQVITNMNVLYTCIVNKPGNRGDVLLNGYVEAMVTLCGAAGAYLIGRVRLDWTYRYGDAFTAFCSILLGVLMMSCYFYDRLIFVYVSYIMYGLVNQMAMALHLFFVFVGYVLFSSEVAKRLHNHCYSLVLGFNLFGSLLTSAILTIFFVQINFLDITVPGRFLFIGGLDVFLGIVYLFQNFVKMTRTQ